MPPSAPERGTLLWSDTEAGGAEFSVAAVRMPMSALVCVIVGIVVVLGATVVPFLAILDGAGLGSGRWLAILVSGGLGIAASIALLATVRLSRRLWHVLVTDTAIVASSRRTSVTIPLGELRLVKLRRHTDYARLVVVGRSRRLTLMAGLGLAADPRDSTAAYLPEFSATVRRHLTTAGLAENRSSGNPDLVTWSRD